MSKSILGRKYLTKMDQPDRRDYPFTMADTPKLTPDKVDLTPFILSIEDQGSEGSCTGHGWTSSKELRNNITKQDKTQLSRQFCYQKILELEGHAGQDVGGQIRTGAQVLSQIGVCAETFMPYKSGGYKTKPTLAAIKDATLRMGGTYERLANINDVEYALSQQLPVVFGTVLYQSFESNDCLKTGHIPMPDLHREGRLGGHCMFWCGYNRRTQTLITPNSWGTKVGDHGIFYMPYDFVRLYCIDMWVIEI